LSSGTPMVTLAEFSRLWSRRSTRLTWLLGAGASAAAGVPTAGQMIWELRRILYATDEGISIKSLRPDDGAADERLLAHFRSSPKFPKPGDPDEYALLFELAWPNPVDRRSYIEEKISLGLPVYGNLIFGILLAMGKAEIVWTTNFDRIVEDSVAKVTGSTSGLTVAAAETADIATQALGDGRRPLYVKLHGDYQSERLRNTRTELQSQDETLRNALVTAAQTYGLIVSGYSGRDESVMRTLRSAIDEGTKSFPSGLYWCHRRSEPLDEAVSEFIDYAKGRGIEAALVEAETYDEVMAALLGTIEVADGHQAILDQARPAERRVVFSRPPWGGGWPVLRLNALQVTDFPKVCRGVECDIGGTRDVRKAVEQAGVDVIAVRRRSGIIAFGRDDEVRKAFDPYRIRGWSIASLDIPGLAKERSTDRGLLYDALTEALSRSTGLRKERRRGSHLLVAKAEGDIPKLLDILPTVDRFKRPIPGGKALIGVHPGIGLRWAEGVELRLEWYFGTLWLVYEPTVWVERTDDPLLRDGRNEFVRNRVQHRYNKVANRFFAIWGDILRGESGSPDLLNMSSDEGMNARFTLDEKNGYSRRSA
jgi:hypothetical protein